LLLSQVQQSETMRFSILSAISTLSALGHALPSNLQTRGKILFAHFICQYIHARIDVAAAELSEFKFWIQYAAAAYCYDSYTAKAGTKLSCSAGNCPDVEAAGATIVYDFSKSVRFPSASTNHNDSY
jgi:hypothetical protein